ncbi:class III lanthionine synthetase LanKC [Saccharomonospora sp. NB11]|jgi:serine/threonine protein kinase|uniref:class III lanthionine synthetase LanKC n=1 Tax=Saccharomonospora sp. NB11 TaxID=1642298 RepID=UPI0018D10540|nr:class III lanthionine synthetase LanKC [Saccharomonospora sp. NB11]
MSVTAREVYTFADPIFYDSPENWQGTDTDSFEVCERAVPPGWLRDAQAFWTFLRPEGATLPEQGWKVHVTAGPEHVDKACALVWDYCVDKGIPFKHLANRRTYLALNSKYAPRGASGKLVTIYPADDAELERVVLDLEDLLAGIEGPAILSDRRWRDSPVYVRYGSFVPKTVLDPDGSLVPAMSAPDGTAVPDRRAARFSVPSWVTPPAFLDDAGKHDVVDPKAFPYKVTRALHFSNAGGVYLATRLTDDKTVVLKEARPGAGLDQSFADASKRLEHEAQTLRTLADVAAVPDIFDVVEAGGHRFIVMEYVEGTNLWTWLGQRHPMIVLDEPTEADYRRYADEATTVLAAVGRALDEIHEHGIGFGDMNFGNVIVQDDGAVRLVDLEMAYDLADEHYEPGLGTIGFLPGKGATGLEIDDYALAALKLSLFFPMEKLRIFDQSKLDLHLSILSSRFGLPDDEVEDIRRTLTARPPAVRSEFVGAPPQLDLTVPDDRRVAVESMQAAILASATPERTDRLFPGDSAGFSPGGGLNLAHGAAGILWALHRTGATIDPTLERWFVDRAREGKPMPPGLYTGAHGVAYVLDQLGHRELALDVLDRPDAQEDGLAAIGMYGGLAGVGLNLLHFTDEPRFDERRARVTERLVEALDGPAQDGGPVRSDGGDRAPSKTGLLHGFAGVALYFLELHRRTGDESALNHAVTALHRDLDRCVRTVSGSLQVEEPGLRTNCYLSVGSAGIALVADEVLDHRHDERIADAVPLLLKACCSEFVLQPQLFAGRAGLLAAVSRHLSRARSRDTELDGAAVVRRHLSNLRWHALSYRGGLTFPGEYCLRLSMDLATGTAGVLLALAEMSGEGVSILPFLSSKI